MKSMDSLCVVLPAVLVGTCGLATTLLAEPQGTGASSSVLLITGCSLVAPSGENGPGDFIIEHNGAGLGTPVYVQERTDLVQPGWTTRPNGPHASPYNAGPAVGNRFFRLMSEPPGGSPDAAAQGLVYSDNAVGYYTLHLRSGFNLIANQVLNGDNNINLVLPDTMPLPNGTSMIKWPPCGTHYDPADAFFAGLGWYDDGLNPSTTALSPGEGAFLELPPGETADVVLVGEIPQGTLTLDICVGLQVLSLMTPQQISLEEGGFRPCDGDSVLFWMPGPQWFEAILYFEGLGWTNGDLSLINPTPWVGEAFFYEHAAFCGPVSWVREFHVD